MVIMVLKRPLYWVAAGPCTNTALPAFTATGARPSPCICNQLYPFVTNKLTKNPVISCLFNFNHMDARLTEIPYKTSHTSKRLWRVCVCSCMCAVRKLSLYWGFHVLMTVKNDSVFLQVDIMKSVSLPADRANSVHVADCRCTPRIFRWGWRWGGWPWGYI
jgi:hypothetical protein